MKKEDYVLFLTGTINTNDNVPFLTVKDNNIRRQQYIDALRFYITKCNVKKILFCENSGEPCPDEVKALAKKKDIDFEWLTFIGDIGGTVDIGKSFGEAELMDFAMNNSRLLEENDYFIKTTGRLIIRNINQVVSLVSSKRNYFVTFGKDVLEKVDTRFFALNVETFKKYFSRPYNKKINIKSNSIESMYPEIIRNESIPVVSLPIQICFEGISGGYGLPYTTTRRDEIKCSFKKYILTLGGHRIYLEEPGDWQGDMQIPEELTDRYFSRLYKKRIVLCGAGMAGMRLYRNIKNKCKIVAWTDANYKNINKRYGIKLRSLEETYRKKVDIYVICVRSKKNYESIKKSIEKNHRESIQIEWVVDLVYDEKDRKIFV
ncbi:hypothetical protein [Pseudobutyrivibrio ruminis]|uniref:hypothetical protein n=1 Tax=Pseudobutyrivibrio ruminis TaxID=46206 RepID=UPI00051B9A1F|nr:hypothetical protein [Pseudobutyrivibrio ruminis]